MNINDISQIGNNCEKPESKFLLLNYSDKDRFFLCPTCNQTPIIKFKDNNIEEAFETCPCGEKKLFNDSEDISENIINNVSNLSEIKKNESIKNLMCENHNKKYLFYCDNDKCKIDLCKECYNGHNGHKIIEFDKLKMEIERKIKYIIDIFGLDLEYNKKDIFDYEFNNSDKLIVKISMIINDYERYPNYNNIRNIKNIYDITNNIIKCNPQNENKIYIRKALDVSSPADFDELIDNKDNRILIKRIRINLNNFYDLKKFENIEMDNLIELELRRNNIKDISFLASAKLLSLKKLDLGMNEIGNNMIKFIKYFEFKLLNYLNFYNNYFSDYEFFEAINHFKELTFLSVSSNRFNYDISTLNIKEIKYNLSKLEKICFNNGVFSDESSILLTRFDFSNAKTIFLASNNLTSIDFIENEDFKAPNLERLCLDNNNISDIKKLRYLKEKSPKLKIIELKNNNIEKIEEVEELISNWEIKEINITGNKISLKKDIY